MLSSSSSHSPWTVSLTPAFFSMFHFVSGEKGFQSTLLHMNIHFSQHHLLKKLIVSYGIVLAPLWKAIGHHNEFISRISILFHSLFLPMPVPHSLDYHSFVVNCEMETVCHPTPFFFSKTPLAILVPYISWWTLGWACQYFQTSIVILIVIAMSFWFVFVFPSTLVTLL
jgi:hypothetical protein